jgi:light-regulated signal transduction histidine kinase (bacteriophytochrome)
MDETERLRQELDQVEHFISMAVHNLREPLRDIAAYSQLLAESYAGRLDSEAGAFLERIEEGAATMESLLAAIMDYWSTGIGVGSPSRIEMEAVLNHALLLADKQITDRNAIVTHDPLPAVMGDFETLARVLHHLIRNAIECCETRSPRVHISSRQLGREWVLSVKDNGPGIDPAFQGRLFSAFRRLHGKEHPGNGLGLAFCKKAIESLGGRVWMESAPANGSTFYFTVTPAD